MTTIDNFGGIIEESPTPYALITSVTRSIGYIVPDCTITEKHFDRLTITQHPVELGAPVTDHSFRNPAVVVMEIGFSNSTAQSYGWDVAAYNDLLGLLFARQPIDVSTGKRFYQNMLPGEITVENTNMTEYALMATVELQEVIITSTSLYGGGAPTANQALPAQTASPASNGFQQSLPAPSGVDPSPTVG